MGGGGEGGGAPELPCFMVTMPVMADMPSTIVLQLSTYTGNRQQS